MASAVAADPRVQPQHGEHVADDLYLLGDDCPQRVSVGPGDATAMDSMGSGTRIPSTAPRPWGRAQQDSYLL